MIVEPLPSTGEGRGLLETCLTRHQPVVGVQPSRFLVRQQRQISTRCSDLARSAVRCPTPFSEALTPLRRTAAWPTFLRLRLAHEREPVATCISAPRPRPHPGRGPALERGCQHGHIALDAEGGLVLVHGVIRTPSGRKTQAAWAKERTRVVEQARRHPRALSQREGEPHRRPRHRVASACGDRGHLA